MDTIHNLFWIILNYSNNLKLTMFLCDRAILLFNEYIVMTKTKPTNGPIWARDPYGPNGPEAHMGLMGPGALWALGARDPYAP